MAQQRAVFNIIAEPEMKGTVIASRQILSLINHEFRSGFSTLISLKERFSSKFVGLAFPSFSPFYESFNELIRRMIQAGLMEYWNEGIINPRGLIKKVDEIGPQVLTLDHLDIAFKIIVIAIVVSVACFLTEITLTRLHRLNSL